MGLIVAAAAPEKTRKLDHVPNQYVQIHLLKLKLGDYLLSFYTVQARAQSSECGAVLQASPFMTEVTAWSNGPHKYAIRDLTLILMHISSPNNRLTFSSGRPLQL